MKTCSQCGVEKPLEDFHRSVAVKSGRAAACKVCTKAKLYTWREKNADKWRTYVRERSRRPEIREKILAHKRSPHALALARARGRDPVVREKKRAWRQENQELCQVWYANKRVRREYPDAGEGITPDQWEHIKANQGHACWYCGNCRPLEIEHRVPLIRGGRHSAENIVGACRACNKSKGDWTDVEFMGARP